MIDSSSARNTRVTIPRCFHAPSLSLPILARRPQLVQQIVLLYEKFGQPTLQCLVRPAHPVGALLHLSMLRTRKWGLGYERSNASVIRLVCPVLHLLLDNLQLRTRGANLCSHVNEATFRYPAHRASLTVTCPATTTRLLSGGAFDPLQADTPAAQLRTHPAGRTAAPRRLHDRVRRR
jgi:hypothetical protein